MIISILNQKGGTGKTTVAVNLARALTKSGIKTLLIDSDAQGSALSWHERTNGQLLDMTCLCKSTLEKDIQKYVGIYDRIIIDGVPSISPLTAASIKCSNFIIIPVTPSPYDIWSTKDLVNSVKDRQQMDDSLKAYFLISRKIVNTNIGKEIHQYLDEMELSTLENGTCNRVDYLNSTKDGMTVVDGQYFGTLACKEVEAILKEVEEKL